MDRTNTDTTCSQHQGLAISCSKIEDMHETIKSINGKVDQLSTQISVLSAQKSERWKVQGWFNKGLAGLMVSVIIAFKIFGGK